MSRSRRLRRRFFADDPLDVAPRLLGKLLVAGDCVGRIVEVEAYRGADDPGSHGYRGVTPRTEVMFGPPGHLYVYFSYGMHWCANVVCAPVGTCGAVLIRALEPVDGLDVMIERRGAVARRPVDLCSGPAKLCQALGVDGRHDGLDLDRAELGVELRDDDVVLPATSSVRIGLARGKGDDLPYRFYSSGNPHVSGRPR